LDAAKPLVPLQPASLQEPALLLVCAEDLHPESLFSAHTSIRTVLCAPSTSAWPFGAAARAFVTSAAEDAAVRAGTHFSVPAHVIASLDPDRVIAAAQAADVVVVLTPFAPVGPVADALADLADALTSVGVRLIQKRRTWDDRFWPYADRGFFKLREKIPHVLAAEGGDL
jgi:deoxyribodipyrimidine photo-lyase